MKKVALTFLLVISAVAAVAGLIRSRSARAMSIIVNVKDLPEHGLRIVGPADPSFKGMAASLTQAKTYPSSERILPFSIFIKNTGNRTVVAYQLKWEVMRADGKVFTRTQGHVVSGAFKGEEDSAGGGKKIRPNSAWFCSLAGAPMEVAAREKATDEPTGSSGFFSTLDYGSNREEVEQAVRDGDRDALLGLLADELAQASSITVSLDGVFFDDGTFIGPDSTGFFSRVKALVDAEHDLLTEVASNVKEKKTPDAIFGRVKELANRPTAPLGPASTPSDFYDHYKKRYAARLLRARGFSGDEQLIGRALQPLSRAWIRPHKQE